MQICDSKWVMQNIVDICIPVREPWAYTMQACGNAFSPMAPATFSTNPWWHFHVFRDDPYPREVIGVPSVPFCYNCYAWSIYLSKTQCWKPPMFDHTCCNDIIFNKKDLPISLQVIHMTTHWIHAWCLLHRPGTHDSLFSGCSHLMVDQTIQPVWIAV